MTGAERGYDPKAEGSRASRVLEERNEAFRVLYDTVVETGGAPGELLYETLCRNLRRICSAQWAALASFDPKTQTLTVQSVSREKDTSAPLSQKDLRKNAPLTDEEVTTLTQNQIRECRGKADCPVRFFPGFDDKNTSFEGLCTVTCVREDRLLAVGVVGLPRGRRLRLEDIIGTYLHLCGMLIQRAESMATLQEQEEMLRATLESTADGILAVDNEGRVTSANSRFLEMWGIPEELYESRKDLSMQRWAAERVEDPEGFLKRIRELYGVSAAVYDEVRFRDGRIFERTSTPLKKGGAIEGRVWSFRDITERRQNEERQNELEEQLRHSQKLEAVGQLAAGVAHDFNNILTAIKGYTELLLTEAPPGSQKQMDITAIKEGADRAALLTKQLLGFGRRQIINPKELDINTVLESSTRMLTRIIGESIHTAFKPSPEPLWVEIDPSQVEQILMNLVINARDAMPHGGALTIETSRRQLEDFRCRHHPEPISGEFAQLSVIDDGEGMDQDTLEHAFEPFFTTKGRACHSGLGLATVYGIIRQNKNCVELKTKRHTKTSIHLMFPLLRRGPGESSGAEPTAKDEKKTGNILVVEDEQTVRDFVERILERAGHRVSLAADGHDALSKIRKLSAPLDVLITDLVMPNMGGRDLTRKARELCPGLQVIFVSGYPQDSMNLQGLLDAATVFISKPFNVRDLLQQIEALLASKA
mgnify:CR=1 FL=1